MLTQNNYSNTQNAQYTTGVVSKTFMANVFTWMFLGLALTAITSYLFASNPENLSFMYNLETGGMNIMGWVIIFAPFALVLFMGAAVNRLPFSTLSLLFIVYSVLMGLSLSFIFFAYTMASIASTFVITAGMFGLMAVVGYTTKTDLTKFGSLMMMGLFGIIIATIVNIFLGSSQLDYIISFIGVLVFTGLTAYDVQKLKRIGSMVDASNETGRKYALMGALNLYLDFINLFLFLLRFFGNRR